MAGRVPLWRRSDVEGDDWVRERTVVMKLTLMTSWINARTSSVVGSGGSCERDVEGTRRREGSKGSQCA
jgi:hypothetical protein